jgi:putative endopeptidase
MKNIYRYCLLLMAATLFCARTDVKEKGIDTSAMDTSVKPGDDFYHYANGTWLKNNPVPAHESRWGSFNIVAERNDEVLKKILEDAASDLKAGKGTTRYKVGAFYRIYMDSAVRETDHLRPAMADLLAVENIKDAEMMMDLVGKFHRKGIETMFRYGVGQDIKNSNAYIGYLSQGGLNLPDRDYYLKTDARSASIREAYVKHVVKLFELFRKLDPHAAEVIKTETVLARSSMTRVERRNQEKQYHKKSYKELVKLYPNLRFETYFKACGVHSRFDSIIVQQPEFFHTLDSLIPATSIDEWKTYLRWCVMNNAAGYLSSAIEKENFRFYGTLLNGVKEQKPRWKRSIDASNAILGEMLGEMFVQKTFSPESKKKVNEMVDNITEAFKQRLMKLDWMSEETRKKAIEKLAAFHRKLGYPDKWRDYNRLVIKEDSYLENSYRASEFNYDDMIDRLGKPVDRGRWNMLPQTVNAYYSPVMNEIVFPAAIMQPPFYDANADDAVNYGSIGAVIGHELTHGFDDQGSKYGPDGNLRSWWTDEDRKKFEARAKVLVNQFNAFEVGDSLHINGELTLGENIADLGGLSIAYDAFKIHMQQTPQQPADGFTPEQRFFLGFAQIWRNNIRPEALRQRILTDPHSPGEFRVLGPLPNMQSFYDAFNVKPGDKMYRKPEDRAVIW